MMTRSDAMRIVRDHVEWLRSDARTAVAEAIEMLVGELPDWKPPETVAEAARRGFETNKTDCER